MKLGKEKLPAKDVERKKSQKKYPSVKLSSPSQPILIAAITVAIFVTVAVVMHHLMVVTPYKSTLEDEVNQQQLNALNLVFSDKLLSMKKQVLHYAENLTESDFEAAKTDRDRKGESAIKVIPGALRVLISPVGAATRDNRQPMPISFASLDTIRSVEASSKARLEAFAVDNKSFIQIVAPKLSDSGRLLGTVLVMFTSDRLQLESKAIPNSAFQLVQKVGPSELKVVSKGVVQEPKYSAATSLPQWSIVYSPTGELEATSDFVLMILIIALGAIASAAIVFLIGNLLLRGLRKDVGLMSAYVKALLQGDNASNPKIKYTLLHNFLVLVNQTKKTTASKKTSSQPTKINATADSAPPPVEAKKKPVIKKKEKEVPEADFTDEAEVSDDEPLFQGDSLDIEMMDDDDDLLGLNEDDLGLDQDVVGMNVGESVIVEVPDEIFRAYDIRGKFGHSLTADMMKEIGRGLGSEAIHRGKESIAVAMDGRLSSPELTETLISGLLSTGINVVNIGVVPTPVLYFAVKHLQLGAGAMVTGSHNPPEDNGLKMVIGDLTLAQEDIQKILARIRSHNFATGKGQLSAANIKDDYVEAIVNDIAVAAPLKVVLDAGNGVAGELAPHLMTELGCEAIPLHCEIDGRFPAHHPDPGQPKNLQDLIAKVKEEQADIGIAFDGDGDRLGVVTNKGEIVWPDRLLMLFAKDVVSRNPGADVIFDVKCSRRLNGLISSFGGRPVMWRTGHSLIKAKMQETGALLAGEMSGHIFFKERWFGFDDGLYSAARLLEILGVDDRDAQSVFDEFPEDVSTPELHVPVAESVKFDFIKQLSKSNQWGEATVSTIDGLRVDYADGWGLCRASNTTPNLVLRFEAETQDGLNRIQQTFRKQLTRIDNSLSLPF